MIRNNDPRIDENVLQAAREWITKFGGWVKQKYNNAEIHFKSFGKAIVPYFYDRKRTHGVLSPATGQPLFMWTEPKKTNGLNHMTIQMFPAALKPQPAPKESEIRSKNRAIPTSIHEPANIPESFLTKLGKELRLYESEENLSVFDTPRSQDYQDKTKRIVGKIQTSHFKDQDDIDLGDQLNSEITQEDLREILDSMITQIKLRTSFHQPIPSIALFGPPGTAKTSMFKAFAKRMSFHYYALEVGGIYDEILGGIPSSDNVVDPTTKLSTSEISLKITKAFPPNMDKTQQYILFFDEFNKDVKKMNIVMNVVLAGEIPAAHYKLPLKTLVIMAGNLGAQDATTVAVMDSAVYDRFQYKALMTADANSWNDWTADMKDTHDYENASLEDDDGVNAKEVSADDNSMWSSGITTTKWTPAEKEVLKQNNCLNFNHKVASVLRWFLSTKTDAGAGRFEKWSLNPENHLTQHSQSETDSKPGFISTRTVTAMGDKLRMTAIKQWVNHFTENKRLVGSEDANFYIKGYKQANYGSPIEYYMEKNIWDPTLLPFAMRTSLGTDSSKFIIQLKTEYATVKDEMRKSMSPIDAVAGFAWRAKHVPGVQNDDDLKARCEFIVEQMGVNIDDIIDFQTTGKDGSPLSDSEIAKNFKAKIFSLNQNYVPTKMKSGTIQTFEEFYNTYGGSDPDIAPYRFIVVNLATLQSKVGISEDVAGTIMNNLHAAAMGIQPKGDETLNVPPNKAAEQLGAELRDATMKPHNPFTNAFRDTVALPAKNESTFLGKMSSQLWRD